MDDAGRAWIEELVGTWREVAKNALRVAPDPLPLIVVFDQSCVWRIEKEVVGAPHQGAVPLPDGESIPARTVSFAGTYGPAMQPFVVMAMPSVWRAEPRHQDNPMLPLLLRAVFAHEMAHALQARHISAWLDDVEKRLGLPEGLDDDIVQTRFESNLEFRASHAAERGLLYQAAAEENGSVRRALVGTAVSMMESRRTRFYSGENAVFAELEDVFLHMEGLGNWVAYQVAVADGMSPADAQAFIRGGRTSWSQDTGLAVFLVVDSLDAGWRDRVLQARPPAIPAFLAEAARR
jgi:hypothetical protein